MEQTIGVYDSIESIISQLERCTECCNGDYTSYHCPLCPVLQYKPRQISKVKKHIEVHWKTAVKGRNDLYAVVCHHYHDGVDKRHFHCPTCEKIIKKKENLINHVKTCTGPVTTDGNEVTGNSTSDERLQASNGDENEQTRQVPPCIDKQNHDDHPDACKKKCDICGKLVHARWLKAHLKQHQKGTSTCGENHHHYTVSISPNEGIFCAAMNMKGPAYPVHIIKKTSGDNTQSFCDNLPCIELKETAKRGGNMAFECSHLQSTPFAKQGRIVNLKEDTLQEIRDKRFITEERHNELITFKNESSSDTSPLIVLIPQDQHTSQRYLYLSVYTGITRYWTKIGRTVVSYDNVERTFTCRCSTSKRYCVHKAIGKWFLFQEMPHCFSSEISSDDDGEEEHAPMKSESTDSEDKFKKCNAKENLNYLLTKKIPPKIPKLRDRVDIREFRPTEIKCHICSGNLKEERCTNRGKIIMMTGVIRDISVFTKICPRCRLTYRYQEWKDGIHNYNNSLLIGLDVCSFLRSGLQNHVAMGRTIFMLEDMLDEKLNHMDILNAYLHFEALTEHEYQYNCVLCGYYPSVIIWDTFRKARFRFAASDLVPPESEHDISETVDTEKFWNDTEKSILARGIDEGLAKKISIKPNYKAWGPWIGKKSRVGNVVYNTEFMKCTPSNAEEINESMPEELLTTLLLDEKIVNVRRICREAGVSSNGSRMDMILRLRQMSITKSSFDRAYEKVFGCSGGWAVGCCKHGIVYAIKNLLRSESPRDYVDIERSFKHRPNVTICDIAHLMATHANRQFQNFFNPWNGRLDEVNEETINAAQRGDVRYTLPFLTEQPTQTPDDNEDQNYNPISGSEIHLALFDWFHQDNCKKRDEVLRKCSLVKEISGIVDTQAVEQLFSSSKKDIYFLNNLSVGNHLFLFRLLYHLRNERKNNTILEKQRSAFSMNINFNRFGQIAQNLYEEVMVQQRSEEHKLGRNGHSPLQDDQENQENENEDQYDNKDIEDEQREYHEENIKSDTATMYTAEAIATCSTPPIRNIPTNEVNQECVHEYNTLMKWQTQEFDYLKQTAQAIYNSVAVLSSEEQNNFIRNIKYANETLFRSAADHRKFEVKTVNTTIGIFQSQGKSSYCGLCCINNAICGNGEAPLISIDEMDEIADRLWIDMVNNPCYGLITTVLEVLRDREGYYSCEVLKAACENVGFNMVYLDSRPILGMSDYEAGVSVIQQLHESYGIAT